MLRVLYIHLFLLKLLTWAKGKYAQSSILECHLLTFSISVIGNMKTFCALLLGCAYEVSPLTREPRRLKLSNWAPILQYVSGLSLDFLVKILGVYNPLFVINDFIFQLLNCDY
jgi:hypothetical protein